MGLLDTITGAVNPYLLYIKIAAVVVLALVIGGLYWYGKHEAGLVDTANQRLGQANQVIADQNATINAYIDANKKWADALKKYQHDAQAQADAYAAAVAAKDRINAQLRDLENRLRLDPNGTAADLNRSNRVLLCMFERASGGNSELCPGPDTAGQAPGSSKPAAR